MPKVRCVLKNASSLISGVQFEPADKGMVSAEVSLEVAEQFLSVPGYELVPEQKPQTQTQPPADQESKEGGNTKAPTGEGEEVSAANAETVGAGQGEQTTAATTPTTSEASAQPGAAGEQQPQASTQPAATPAPAKKQQQRKAS